MGGAGARSSSREPGSMASCLGGEPPSHAPGRGSARAASPGGRPACLGGAAYDSRASGGIQYGGGLSGGPFAMAPAPQTVGGKYGMTHQAEANSLVFGARSDAGPSNAYACGANQNCGNGITDRRTTRVLQ